MSTEFIEKTKNFLIGAKDKENPDLAAEESVLTSFEGSSSLGKALMGGVGVVADYYFPPDLLGGCCPRVVGEEQEIVWNAAAEAADTERVHIVWQAQGEKIWYLAILSADQSSHPDTWCPFASLLPGMKEAADPPVIYTYFSDETATMMTVLPDALQIHRGTGSVIRAKAERTSREYDNAPVVDLVPDRIAKLTPFPWFSISLFEERARRVLATVAVASALVFAGVAMLIWFGAAMVTISASVDRDSIQKRSEEKSLELLRLVQAQRSSPMRGQLADFADVNDGLLTLSGYLEIYMFSQGKPVWRAIIPPNITSERIKELGAQTLDNTARGVVIGNSTEAVGIEDQRTKKRRK